MYIFSQTGSTYVRSSDGTPATRRPRQSAAPRPPASPPTAPASTPPTAPASPPAAPAASPPAAPASTPPAAPASPSDFAEVGASPPLASHRRTKTAQRQATTKSLIDAARELFAARGYAAVGTEEIVQQAGVTRGALYHHFKGGKEELFRAVLVQLSAETVRRVAQAATNTQDPWEALVAGADAFLDACATPEVQRIMLVDGPAVLGWEVWRAIDSDYGLGLLERALQRAMDAGAMLPAPTSAVAHVLTGALDEAAMVVARSDDPAAARTEMGHTVRRLFEGLRGPAAR